MVLLGAGACATAPTVVRAPAGEPKRNEGPLLLPTGTFVTPTAARGARLFELDPHLSVAPSFRAGNAVRTVLSPDGATLLVLTSGYNRMRDASGADIVAASGEYVFVYDVAGGMPRETGVVIVPNTFVGLAFHPRGDAFYVSGGPDDVVHEITREGAKGWRETLAPIALGHLDARGLGGLGRGESPYAAGLALDPSGARLVVANHENDSLTVIDTAARAVVAEVPLRPGGGVAGGEFPLDVIVPARGFAYVTCQRDREVVEVDLDRSSVARRIRVGGQPTRLVANLGADRLYVANANSDTVSVVDRASGRVVTSIPTAAPPGKLPPDLRGASPNALALSPDERTLYVTNGGDNTLAIVDLDEAGTAGRVAGLVPTGFYPTSVTPSRDGRWLYVTHAKSATGPNPEGPWSVNERSMRDPYAPGSGNQFSLQLVHGGLLAFPTPTAAELPALTARSLENARMDRMPEVPKTLAKLRGRVKHVVYVIAENRTYDQILGDLPGADGDPKLVHWGERITPNQHALAKRFVTLDRFFDAGGVSGDGWQWSTSARTTDVAEKAIPLEYASRGHHSYDWEGMNRNVNVALPTLAERRVASPHTPDDPDLLPGTADVGAVDGPAEGGRGFLWDAALAAGLTVRNYGVFVDDSRYALRDGDDAKIPLLVAPHETQTRVAYATRPSLLERTDPYFRGFDMAFPDLYRVREWQRELAEYVKKGNFPALELVRLPHDHLGAFGAAMDGVDTPDTQQADHDYAVGLLVESLAATPFWKDTVVVVVEDDAQNGSDHVDAHRSLALFAGGPVRRGALVHTSYATPSLLRTLEILLGLAPLGQSDAFAPPMDDVFTDAVDTTPFVATVPDVLRSTTLPLPPLPPGAKAQNLARPRGTAASWAIATDGYDFSHEDRLPAEEFNRLLYCELAQGAACGASAATQASVSRARAVPREDDGDDDD